MPTAMRASSPSSMAVNGPDLLGYEDIVYKESTLPSRLGMNGTCLLTPKGYRLVSEEQGQNKA